MWFGNKLSSLFFGPASRVSGDFSLDGRHIVSDKAQRVSPDTTVESCAAALNERFTGVVSYTGTERRRKEG